MAPTVAGSIPVSHPMSYKDSRPQMRPIRAWHASSALFVPLVVALLAIARPWLSAADGRFDQTLPVSGQLRLDITTDAGDIALRAGDPGKIEIHAKLHSIDDSGDDDVATRIHAIELTPPIVNDARGHSVRIGHIDDPEATRNISISYEIVVPVGTELHSETGVGDQNIEGIQGPVEATSGSGKLHVWHIGKDVHVSTGSGDLDVHDIHGNVQAKAGTGSVYASEIISSQVPSHDVGPVQLQNSKTGLPITVQLTPGAVGLEIVTGSGDVDVENLQGGLEVTSGSGNIHATGKPASDWRVDTGTGTIRVQFPADANVALVAHTSSGTIESGDAVAVQGKKNPHELRGQIGKGGPTVNLKTASGNIEIK